MNNKGWRQGFVEGYGALNPPQKPTFASGGEVDKYMKELQARRAAMPAPGPLQDYITSLNNRTVPSYQNIAARGRTNPDGTPKPWAKPSDFPYTGPIGGGGGGGAGAGLGGAALGLLAFLAKNPDMANKLFGQIKGLFGEKFDPEKFATSDEAQAATDQAQAEADARELARGTDPNLPDSTFDTAAGAAAAGAAAGATTGTTPAQQADITPRDLVTDESLIDQRAAEQEQEQAQEQTQSQPAENQTTANTASAATSGAVSGATTTPAERTGSVEVVDENVGPQQTQTQPQPTSTASSALPTAASAGLGALASGASSTLPATASGAYNMAGQLIAGRGVEAAAGAAGAAGAASNLAPDIAARLAGVRGTINEGTDMLAEIIEADPTSGLSGFNPAAAAGSIAATLAVPHLFGIDSPEGQMGSAVGSAGASLASMAGVGGMGSLGWAAGPVGAIVGGLAGQFLAETRPPLLNPVTNQYIQPGDNGYGALSEYYQRNVNTPEAITSYDYSTEDQARLQSMFDMASTDPGAFDPNAVSNVTTAATGLTYNPMSLEELTTKLSQDNVTSPYSYTGNQQITTAQPAVTQPATTAQPAATQSSAVAAAPRQPNSMYGGPSIDTSAMEQQMAAYDPYAYLNEYYSDNMYGFAGGGEIPDAGGSDLGPHEYSAGGKFLRGDGDGMSDDIVANIDGTQEARLADGEFVIPADVVSHLGNGSSEAGSRVLYAMMDRVRKARTGSTKQGKQIDPDDHVPA